MCVVKDSVLINIRRGQTCVAIRLKVTKGSDQLESVALYFWGGTTKTEPIPPSHRKCTIQRKRIYLSSFQ